MPLGGKNGRKEWRDGWMEGDGSSLSEGVVGLID